MLGVYRPAAKLSGRAVELVAGAGAFMQVLLELHQF